ncbi:hypothetical protein BBO99_00001213 [Phytophthora kernoviae]|uniref:Uncharacterized protein n=2 Tax=Phytophthora kernoviae TaxID=325452 RepID=A0A3R7H254_9STRA|nr:hypothetical protein G195_002957 [Phytophthora kernoviae 00238/432]KAG2526246.1 hypothetical protein JM16_002066 [Phytophthora kernoviae]KAG2527825.1 hypothetical protein JM18_002171 [Phytophthora kernoviae]RLN02269.1 hypothetical protein BBI17_006193 [Phytophthora kernoviae]RLN84592.1 hypothetical protein BBO99_00001213 [Phytophthora kernoviae]
MLAEDYVLMPRLCHDVPWLELKKVSAGPKLLPHHQMARKKWGDDLEGKTNAEWAAVLFSDEKKWNLDERDGLQQHWIGTWHPDPVVVCRHSGSGSVMA